MGNSVTDLVARIESIGGRLALVDGSLEYEGPIAPLTAELRRQISTHKAALIDRLRPRTIAELLVRLADHGAYVALTPEGPELRHHEGADPLNIAQAVVAELNGRLEELVAWLWTPAPQLPRGDLIVLGFDPAIAKDGTE